MQISYVQDMQIMVKSQISKLGKLKSFRLGKPQISKLSQSHADMQTDQIPDMQTRQDPVGKVGKATGKAAGKQDPDMQTGQTLSTMMASKDIITLTTRIPRAEVETNIKR